MGPRPTQQLVLGHIMGSRRGQRFILGLHTTIFQAERYAIKVCVMDNTEKGHKGRNIYVLSDGRADVKARDSFQIHALKNNLHLYTITNKCTLIHMFQYKLLFFTDVFRSPL
jgi:hypothetical protein